MPKLPTVCLIALLGVATPALAAWDPAAIGKENTLEFLTVGAGEGEHWSTVWLVVIDGQVYIRLGSRAAERMEQTTTRPYVKLRVAGQQFDKVKAEPVPDMAGPVAQAMGEKYWSNFLVRHFNHPLTMRLTLEP